MGKIVFADSVSNVDPGDYLVGMTLTKADGTPVATGPTAPVTIPTPLDVPVFEPPTVTVEP